MTNLHVAPGFTFPVDLITQKTSILARTGAAFLTGALAALQLVVLLVGLTVFVKLLVAAIKERRVLS
jgi:hypothetical protein